MIDLKQCIVDYVNREKINFPLENMGEINSIVYEIEEAFELPFSICFREDGSTYWLQVEYYSESIKKTIIFDYNFDRYFISPETLAQKLVELKREIELFEDSLSEAMHHND